MSSEPATGVDSAKTEEPTEARATADATSSEPPPPESPKGSKTKSAKSEEAPAKTEDDKVIDEGYRVSLKVAIPVLVLLLGGAVTVGKVIGSVASASEREAALKAQIEDLKSEQAKRVDELRGQIADLSTQIANLRAEAGDLADLIVKSLENNDDAARKWIRLFRPILPDYDWYLTMNARGLRIYLAEKERSRNDKNRYRREQIQRAQSWFSDSLKEHPSYSMALWNHACMNALLGDVQGSLTDLRTMFPLVPQAEKATFENKACTDTDFCVIQEKPEFKAYAETLGCTEPMRPCPSPNIVVD